MSNPGEKWLPIAISNPSTRLRVARSMPHWVMAQNQVDQQHQMQSDFRRPPTPPDIPPPSLTGDCGDPDYEVIEFPPLNQKQPLVPSNKINGKFFENNQLKNVVSSIGMVNGRFGRANCCLCGVKYVTVRCEGCSDLFCESCDEANHRHPKRRDHARHRLQSELSPRQVKPPLPPKGDPGNPPPVPPPRRNRRPSQGKASSTASQQSSTGFPAFDTSRSSTLRRGIVGSTSMLSRPLPATPPRSVDGGLSQEGGATATDKMSALQERYRRYQEAMRAQDATRRRQASLDSNGHRESFSPRPMSMSATRQGFPSQQPSRAMMQSSSVCDLSAPSVWNPCMQQAQSVSQFGTLHNQMMWYPPTNPWDVQNSTMGGSNLNLSQGSIWPNYSMGFGHAGSQFLPTPYLSSRSHSPAHSVKSGKRFQVPSPSSSLKSRKSTVSARLKLRPSPSSPSDASSEDSDESDFDDRMSKSSKQYNGRTDSIGSSRAPKSRAYHQEEFIRNSRIWRSEDRISSREEQWMASHFSVNDYQESRNSIIDDDSRSLASSRHFYDDDQGTRLYKGDNLKGRSGQSPEDSVNGQHDDQLQANTHRLKVTSSSDDYVDRHERCRSLPRSRTREPVDRNIEDIKSKNGRRKSNSCKSGRFSSHEDSDGINRNTGFLCGQVSDKSKQQNTPSPPPSRRLISKSSPPDRHRHQDKLPPRRSPTPERRTKLVDKSSRSSTPDKRSRIHEGKPPMSPMNEQKFFDANKKNDDSNKEVLISEVVKNEWSCEHCTFLNDPSDKICAVCCKTKSSELPPSREDEDDDETPNSFAKLQLDVNRESEALKIQGRTRRKISFSFGTKFAK